LVIGDFEEIFSSGSWGGLAWVFDSLTWVLLALFYYRFLPKTTHLNRIQMGVLKPQKVQSTWWLFGDQFRILFTCVVYVNWNLYISHFRINRIPDESSLLPATDQWQNKKKTRVCRSPIGECDWFIVFGLWGWISSADACQDFVGPLAINSAPHSQLPVLQSNYSSKHFTFKPSQIVRRSFAR
jgi:hypothetical protein